VEEEGGEGHSSDETGLEEGEELLPEEVEEAERLAARRGRRSSGGVSEGGVGSPSPEPRRRRAAPASAAAEVVELLSEEEDDIDWSGARSGKGPLKRGTPAIQQQRRQQQRRRGSAPPRPRTKAGDGAELRALRLTFRTRRDDAALAVATVRPCCPLRAVMAEVAARCLAGGGGDDAEAAARHLAFTLGSLSLDPEHTVRQAGLTDGAVITVSIRQ
jgi:hypothetical protein